VAGLRNGHGGRGWTHNTVVNNRPTGCPQLVLAILNRISQFGQKMSKTHYGEKAPRTVRLGDWLRELREGLDLPLRAVADATNMDLAHLHKIEQGQLLPTEEQASRLAIFFKLDETGTQARRIAEKFRHDFAENPAAKEAINILAEEAGGWAGGKAAKATRET
jgi:transcriptional regulator with XRE-family HTH domain